MKRGAWWATVHGATENQTLLSNQAQITNIKKRNPNVKKLQIQIC